MASGLAQGVRFRGNLEYLAWLLVGLVLAGAGPIAAILLAQRDILYLIVSDRDGVIFIGLMLLPCLVALVMLLERVRSRPFGMRVTAGVIAACILVLGCEIFLILHRLLF